MSKVSARESASMLESEECRTFGAWGEERGKGVGANDPGLAHRARDGRRDAAEGGGSCREDSTLAGSLYGDGSMQGRCPCLFHFSPCGLGSGNRACDARH